MDTLSLKNKCIIFIFCLLFINCKNKDDQMYVLKNELPIISVRNSSEKDIIDSKFSLKRNNTIVDVGNLLVYSKSNNTIDISLLLKKTDTVYKTDTILVYIKNKCFTLSNIEKKGVISSGKPFIISYKINNKNFIDRNGFYVLSNTNN